jgi:hypothetical protein
MKGLPTASHSQPSMLEGKIQYWEGWLRALRDTPNIDAAEVWVRMPPGVEDVAFELLRERDRNPLWEPAIRLYASVVIPLVERFIADLRSLREN